MLIPAVRRRGRTAATRRSQRGRRAAAAAEHDLWLCERIADHLALEPLKPARIGTAWKVPYGLGRDLTPTDG